jgi:hypothetical protein
MARRVGVGLVAAVEVRSCKVGLVVDWNGQAVSDRRGKLRPEKLRRGLAVLSKLGCSWRSWYVEAFHV